MDKRKEIKELYDKCSSEYDKHMSKTGHYSAQRRILRKIRKEVKDSILDLASGTGYLIGILKKRHKKVYANDFSKEMQLSIEQKYPDIKTTNENAENLKSYNQRFNTIISCNLFYYLQDRDKAINRWEKLLETKGKIILIEESPFIKPNSNEMDKYSNKLMRIIDIIPLKDISNLFEKKGFSLIKKVSTRIDKEHNLYGLVFSRKPTTLER